MWLWGHGHDPPHAGLHLGRRAGPPPACTRPPVFFAHSDMSGISIFEEANERGVQAADAVRAFVLG